MVVVGVVVEIYEDILVKKCLTIRRTFTDVANVGISRLCCERGISQLT